MSKNAETLRSDVLEGALPLACVFGDRACDRVVQAEIQPAKLLTTDGQI